MFASSQTPLSTLTSSLTSLCSTITSTTNTKIRVLNSDANKHLLTQGINILSTNVQKSSFSSENNSNNSKKSGDCVILKLENEALEHIEHLILEVFDSIILASSNLNDNSPEQTCALIMSNSNSQKIRIFPITNLKESELRVKQILPRSYSEDACARAFKIVEKCKNILNSNKKNRLLSKVMNTSSTNSLSILTSPQINSNSSDTNNNLTYIFSFPLEKIHNLLVEIYQIQKLDVQVTIFLVAILEHITKDVLRLSSSYSRHLNQYIINKRDVNISIEGDLKLKKLFFSNTPIPQNNDFLYDDSETSDINDEFEDDDFREIAYVLGRFDPVDPNFFFSNRSNIRQSTISIASIPGLSNSNDSTISPSNPDECASDSSTICPDSITYENVNLRYYRKVKELILEQQQHLTDLNIIRRIFMYLFQKFVSKNNSIEQIFGNINDVYDCALRLNDLLDDVLLTQTHSRHDQDNLNNQNQSLLVGQQFWELAEGSEFDVYNVYADTVTNYSNLKSSLFNLLDDTTFCKNLQCSGQGLIEISKYLLPKLLLGPVYHFLYLFETISNLEQISFDEDDKTFLSDTLDTFKPVIYYLKEKEFVNSKKRPIETSFRIFQPHQIQPLEKQTQSINSSASIGQSSIVSTITSKTPALAYNICILNERKWKEIETSVDSLKLPSHINQIISQNNPNLSKNLNSSCSNLRYAYLYEGNLQICKTTQQIQSNTNLKSHVGSQSKIKVSKRYVYLFDGLLIFVKKQQASPLLNTNLGTKPYRFKETIEFDKCILKDREDECCFELHKNVFDFDSTLSNQSQLEHTNQEYILFITDTASDKYKWMSMLCYSFYKLKIDGLLADMTKEHNKNNPLPIPPSGYIFDQPDSPETILFEDKNKSELTVNPYSNSDGLTIKAATLIKLVERLTHHHYIHPKFLTTFLMFFRKFTTSKEFLDLLALRFEVPDLNVDEIRNRYNFTSGSITERELLKRYRREYQQPIRLKVINLIKHWVNGYFNEDFAEDPDLLVDLKGLIEKIGKNYKRFEQVLTKTLQKKIIQYQEQLANKLINEDVFSKQNEGDLTNLKNIFKKKFSTSSSSNTSLSNVSSRSSSTSTNEDLSSDQDLNDLIYPPFETHLETTHPYDILTIHPLEFARQATLMEEELFKAIKPNELISLGWSKPDQKYKLSPNVSKLITLSNKFTYWYAKCIVDTQNLEERIAVVHRLLDIAYYFYELNNFSGLKEIYAAFETSFTLRLEITREKSGLEQHRMYEIFKQLFDIHDKGYFDRLKKCSPPCIPFIGFHLSIILKAQEWNKMNLQKQNELISDEQKKLSSSNGLKLETLDNNSADGNNEQPTNLINFSKYRLLVDFVNDLLQYQSVSYKFRINNNIRSYLLEDIENYFEAAKQELEPISGESDQNETKKIEDIVVTLLYNKSRQIEPNDVNNFPRIRNYPLKSPPLRSAGKASNNTSKLNESNRSQSATRAEKKINNLNTSKQFIAPVFKNSTTSIAKPTSNIQMQAIINSSVTSYCIGNKDENSGNLLYKRSNSSNQNNFKPSDESISNIFASSASPLNHVKNIQFTHSKSASSSSSIQFSQNFDINQANVQAQKLSLSSADSSSSAPNSPPPNYEDVFDSTNTTSNYPLITNPAILQFQQDNKCFDNKTYFHKSSSSSPSFQKINASNRSDISPAFHPHSLNTQNCVFSFPDLNENFAEANLRHSIDDISPIFPLTPSLTRSRGLPPAPTYRPPSPPHQPPPITRSNLNSTGHSSSNTSISPLIPPFPTIPPPVPPRPNRKN